MQFNEETMAILKNFETINPSLCFAEGNKLETCMIAKHIFARAILTEDIEQDFAIYNMNQFLNTINMFHEPRFEFSSKFVTISSEYNQSSTNYYFCPRKVVDILPDPEVLEERFYPPEEKKNFLLSESTIKDIQKAANVLVLDSIMIKAEDGKIVLNVFDSGTSPHHNNFEKVLSDAEIEDVDFDNFTESYILPIYNLKMIPGNYKARIGTIKGGGNLLYLKADWEKKTQLDYWLTLKAT